MKPFSATYHTLTRQALLHLLCLQGPDGGPPPPMPMLMKRTPYSVAPYGIDSYPAPSGWFKTYAKEGWIFVYQVRGIPTPVPGDGRARWRTRS